MTGTYPSFMATQDGRAILGRQPTLQDMLRSVAQGAPTSTGGYGGSPQGLGYPGGGQTFVSGTGDRAMGSPGSPYFNLTFGQPTLGAGAAPAGPAIGGGGRGIALPPGTQTPSTPVPGQGVPTGAGGGVAAPQPAAPGGALTVQQLLRQLGMVGGGTGGGGAGGAGGTAPGGIGRGQTGQEMGQAFADANAAVSPSVMSALNIAGSIMSPLTGLPTQLMATAFPQLGNLLGGFGTGFNVPGPQLTPNQLAQISQAYSRLGPAYAQSMLQSMRQQRQMAGQTGGVIPGSAAALGGAPAAMGSSGYGGIGPGGIGGGDPGGRGETNPGGLGGGIGGGGFGGGAMGAGSANRSF